MEDKYKKFESKSIATLIITNETKEVHGIDVFNPKQILSYTPPDGCRIIYKQGSYKTDILLKGLFSDIELSDMKIQFNPEINLKDQLDQIIQFVHSGSFGSSMYDTFKFKDFDSEAPLVVEYKRMINRKHIMNPDSYIKVYINPGQRITLTCCTEILNTTSHYQSGNKIIDVQKALGVNELFNREQVMKIVAEFARTNDTSGIYREPESLKYVVESVKDNINWDIAQIVD